MTVRVRFAPSPTGSLHVGNALTAVANRRFADERGGVLVLRIDDTDPTRTVAGGEDAIVEDLSWLGIGWDEGPIRQSERAAVHAEAAARALENGALRDEDGSIRLGRTTLLRADGSAIADPFEWTAEIVRMLRTHAGTATVSDSRRHLSVRRLRTALA